MKKINLFAFSFLFTAIVIAQQKNPTNTKEIQDKLKQAQQQMDKLTPEQKKMMEQMGVSSKIASLPAGTTDADVKAAVGGSGAFGIPSKNNALIAAIPQLTITAANLPGYIKTLNDYVEKGVASEAKFTAQNMYAYFKTNKYKAETIGNEAVGLWAIGQPEVAVYIMSRACADNATDADLLSNFAAMLSMGGAPHRAIPLLQYLNKQFPENSTILNNLGQAWFCLGETEKANAQLDKAVKAFAYHPQANYTQCLIEQGKGNTTKAIEKMKNSLAYSFSMDKINMLRKLGYKVKGSDMRKPFRPDPNPLGLQNFKRPEVPVSYTTELTLKADWDAFQRQLNDKNMQLAKALIPYQQAANKNAQQLYNQYQKNGINGLKTNAKPSDNIYRYVAEKNLEEMNKDGGAGYRLKKAIKNIDAIRKDFQTNDEKQRKIIEQQKSSNASKETELSKAGESDGFDNCVVQKAYSEWVYATYNKPLEDAYQDYLHQLYLKISEELYWKQFTQDEATFEATKITAQKEWLAALGNTRYIATNLYGNCSQQENKGSRYKLTDFDDMHCAYVSTMDLYIVKQTFECGKERLEFDAEIISGELNWKMDNHGNDKFVKGTLEANMINKSIGAGPLEASATAGMGVEFTSNGVEDVYVKGEVSAANISASGKMSLISGNMTGAISGFGK